MRISFFAWEHNHQHLYDLTQEAITKAYYLAYWKEGSDGGNATSIKGDKGIRDMYGQTYRKRLVMVIV